MSKFLPISLLIAMIAAAATLRTHLASAAEAAAPYRISKWIPLGAPEGAKRSKWGTRRLWEFCGSSPASPAVTMRSTVTKHRET